MKIEFFDKIKSELYRARLVVFAVFVFFMGAVFAFLATGNIKGTSATTAGFKAGNIITDYVMSNDSTMSVADIQNFLSRKNPCDYRDYNKYVSLMNSSAAKNKGYSWHWDNGHFVCLAEERFDGQSAAQIIYDAAKDYHINPQVLIVLLEKEQGLITDKYPNNIQYRSATGYGCPDTAACDTKYYGFKNQVRNAAALFHQVLTGGWSNYHVGNNQVAYHPNGACGSSTVYIENLATAALYRYTPYQPNSAALNWSSDGCSSYGNRNFYHYFTEWFGSTQTRVINQNIDEPKTQNDLSFDYQTHVAEIGWQSAKSGGLASGTVGQSIQLEAFKLNLGENNSKVVYRAHIQGIGWESTWHHGGETAGTTGQSKAVEAVQLQLIDGLAEQYDIYYRVHAADIGWMNWTKNGDPAGTTGESRKIEAIQIAIVKKNSIVNFTSGVTDIAFRGGNNISKYFGIIYQAHTANIGWMNWVENGKIAGTTGQSRSMEALNIKIYGNDGEQYSDLSVQYRAHVANIGWMDWVKDGQTAGTTGRSLPMEAVEIKLVKK